MFIERANSDFLSINGSWANRDCDQCHAEPFGVSPHCCQFLEQAAILHQFFRRRFQLDHEIVHCANGGIDCFIGRQFAGKYDLAELWQCLERFWANGLTAPVLREFGSQRVEFEHCPFQVFIDDDFRVA